MLNIVFQSTLLLWNLSKKARCMVDMLSQNLYDKNVDVRSNLTLQ